MTFFLNTLKSVLFIKLKNTLPYVILFPKPEEIEQRGYLKPIFWDSDCTIC